MARDVAVKRHATAARAPTRSQKPIACMIAERLRPPVVSLERLDPAVPRHIHDLEDVGAVLEGGGHEAGAQRVPGEHLRIEARGRGVALHDLADCVIGYWPAPTAR
jgi:hypothetical protein